MEVKTRGKCRKTIDKEKQEYHDRVSHTYKSFDHEEINEGEVI